MADIQEYWQSILNQIADNRVRLKVYRGTNKAIEDLPDEDGALYFAYDSGAIFLGRNTGTRVEKVQMSSTTGGAGGSGIVYANADEEEGTLWEDEDEESETYKKYYIYRAAFEEDLIALPGKDTLIINSNGWLFRVLKVFGSDGYVLAELVSTGTGSGGGGSGGNVRDLDLTYSGVNLLGSTYIYNKSYDIVFQPSSTADEVCSILIEAVDNTGKNLPVSRSATVANNAIVKFNVNLLPLSNDITLTVTVNSQHSEYNKHRGYTNSFPIRTLDMHLSRHSESNFIGIQAADASLACIPYFTGLGTTENPVKLYYSIDGGSASVGTPLIASQSEGKVYLHIPHQAHGSHSVLAWLGVMMDGIEFTSDTISYEVPFVDNGNTTPLIWVKEELGTVIQYEEAVVQYMIYSSVDALQGHDTEVQFLKNGVLFNTEEVTYSSTRWLRLDLTANYNLGRNSFSIVCGSTVKNITFQVTAEGARDLSIKYPADLEINFDSMGRSSKEIKATRSVWNSTATPKLASSPYSARLTNFNWYNNGWKNDDDGYGSYLAVTNGAEVSIPAGIWTINTADSPWTFEIRFRVRNAKKFATLVTEIPIYVWKNAQGEECESGQEKTLEEIAEIEGATPVRDGDGNLVMNEANTTRKIVRSDKYIAFKYLNSDGRGLAIGTQEAYFNIGGRVVNVKYRENEIISISFVIDKTKNQLSIYLNGILSGVADLSGITGFTMQNIPFTINSDYCDFDLYKFRIYQKALSMPDVIHNYIADIKNIDLYDENQLTDINDETKIDYDKLLLYNYGDPTQPEKYPGHPDSPTMPYVVIDMSGETSTGNDELPFSKTAKGIDGTRIEFTNPTGDYLLETNQITDWEYYTRSPSYTADNVNINVQGTSSQIYPRRNFKTKFKKAKNWVFTKGPLAGQSIAADYYFNSNGSYAPETAQYPDETADEYKARTKTFGAYKKLKKKWHLDSENHSTNKFTWKIDYMESSGSYNTGFANLMGSGVYSKHPLEDLNISGLDASTYRTSVYGFPMLAFHKTADGKYTYIGRYNCNLDKGSNEYYGFEEEVEQPYVTLQRTVEDDNGETTIENYHPLIADVAECWELRDNQGLWCSFRYPNNARAQRFETPISDTDTGIEVVKHFEARYHKYADQFEWGQNVIIGKENNEDFSEEVGNDKDTINGYLLSKLVNLQALFDWLDSTDPKSVTDNPLSEVIGQESVTYRVSGIVNEDQALQQGITYYTDNSGSAPVRMGTFTKDSAEYRRQKFYNEFDLHLDKHYCSVYFVMTELLLCYDSRGKNMMIATFGPTPNSQGNYVWYPIFYDIDTQLGLNNVGAKLWDYDEDCTENGTFSTAQSVLWTNFNDLFKQQIIATYRQLRGSGDDGKLSYKNIEGAYACDPTVFKTSYAMRGRRPIVAMGLDEYYKYVLPVTTPWRNQQGNMITANYLYACQGDRKLSRELLINNRLLYMDSKWLGGTFTISSGGMAGVMFRSTANHEVTTSDKYIDLINSTGYSPGDTYVLETEDDQGNIIQHRYVYQPYQAMKYIDATPQYNVTPYLNFYVTTFVDENTFQNEEAYNEDKYPNGIPTKVLASVQEAYQYGRVDQQLNYFAGSEYISSLGDLSTKYANQVKIPDTPRLLDITLGSDAPGYFNNENLNPFELYTEVDDATGLPKKGSTKSLLDRIILSNLRGLHDFLDIRSPDKLTEFRALGTSLTYALFAEGAPLSIVHLPNTVEKLIFIQNKNLTRIITETPQVLVTDENNQVIYNDDGNLVYKDRSEYSGLFVDGLTNYNSNMAGQGSPISEIDIEGDNMGYDSYILLKNLVAEKNGTGRDKSLAIKMTDVKWTPYTQVEYGEAKVMGTNYYYLTDHSTYISYSGDENAWAEDTLNGRVFTFDENAPKSTIQDLSLLDIFYEDYRLAYAASELNQFRNNTESMMNICTYPTLSGQLYVDNTNGTAINELTLTNKYNACWPDLIIRAANVEEAPAVKYVEIDATSGKEKQVDIKYSEDNKIVLIDKQAPNRVHFDFLGWSPDKPDTTENPTFYVVLDANNNWTTTEQGAAAIIDPVTRTMVLYAIFVPHQYPSTFDFNNGEPPIVITTTWEQGKIGLNAPNTIPTKQYPYADDVITPSGMLGLYRTYAFKGWAYAGDEDENIQNLDNLPPDHIYSFVAIYEDKSVYDNVLDLKYLVVDYDANTGVQSVGLNSQYVLSGKITLPTVINGHPVTSLGSSASSFAANKGHSITHIFWARENRALTNIANRCFENSTSLVYCEPIPSCTTIGSGAFSYCSNLREDNVTQLLEYATSIGGSAFYNVVQGHIDVPGHTYTGLSEAALGGWEQATELILGSEIEPCQWIKMYNNGIINNNSNIFQYFATMSSGIKIVHIYIPSSDNTEENKAHLLQAMGFGALIDSPNYVWKTNDTNLDAQGKSYAWIIVN